ncbi:MAG: MarR family transcriptional regulator [Hyphomicrobiales bacterium]|nr:MarR family transcriptional regulator [Hyphomicrobiales bacterium]
MVANVDQGIPGLSASKARLKLWIQLLRNTRSIETEIRGRLRREFNETLPRFDVMAALYKNPDGIMMSGLSRVLVVSNGNVTGIVERLVKDQLAVRSQRDGDRRTWIIRLTTAGVEHFEMMANLHEQWIDELLQNIDPDHVDLLNTQLSGNLKYGQDKHD